jgi:hypothetical protein
MKALRLFYYAIAAYAIFVLFVKCMSLSGYETGRTMEHEEVALEASINLAKGPVFFIADDNGFGYEITDLYNYLLVDTKVRYGATERLEIGAHASSSALLGIMAKYQILGNKRSPFALAIGLEGGIFAEHTYFQIPVCASWDVNKYLRVYLSPRFIRRNTKNVALAEGYDYLRYQGFNTGVWFLKKDRVNIGIDGGLYLMGGGHSGSTWLRETRWLPVMGISFKWNL